jgi:hypothetical protein
VPRRAERMVVMMSHKMLSVALAALFGVAVIGCDEKLAEEKKVDVKDDGTVVTDKKTVTEKPDGTIVEETSKDVDKPARDGDADDKDGEVKLKVDVDKE